MSHEIHIIIMCNHKTVFTKTAQKLYMLQFKSVYPFHWINSAGIFVIDIVHGLELKMLIFVI